MPTSPDSSRFPHNNLKRVTLAVTLFVCITLGACSPPKQPRQASDRQFISAFDLTHIFNLVIEPDLATGAFRLLGDAELVVLPGSTDASLNGVKVSLSFAPEIRDGELFVPMDVQGLLEKAIYRNNIYSYTEPAFTFTPSSPSPLPSWSRPPETPKRLSATVVLDPGHGGRDPGAIGPRTGVFEKTLNLAVAIRVRTLLEEQGCKVVMTRSDDRFITLEQRAAIANSAHADCFVSIHFNASTAHSVRGFEAFYSNNNPNGQARLDQSIYLARFITDNLNGKWTTENRGVHHLSLYVTRHTTIPSVLVEVEFITNTELEPLLAGEWLQKRAAMGVAQGIIGWLAAKAR